jgi:hypothetical protein
MLMNDEGVISLLFEKALIGCAALCAIRAIEQLGEIA